MPASKAVLKRLYKNAANTYARKIKLERSAYDDVDKFLNKIARHFSSFYAKNGVPINVSVYQKELENMLRDHHIRVASNFDDEIRKLLGTPNNEKLVARKLEGNIKGYAAQRAHLMSHSIIDTTRDHIESAVKNAFIQVAKDGIPDSNRNIARLATENLRDRIVGRAKTISITETQSAAEKGKSMERDTLLDLGSSFGDKPFKEMTRRKVWIALLDDHTREDHVDADSQEVDDDEPFEVGGDQLMEPGDDSLGAGPDQICNCRCSSELYFE